MSTLTVSPRTHPIEVVRTLLLGAVAVPFLYYGTLLLAAAMYPGYSHMTQYASELGSASATYPAIFNTGAILGGLAGVLAGVGVYRALRGLGRGMAMSAAVALAIIGQAIGFIFAGLYPMPNELHGGYGVGMLGMLGPASAAFALRGSPTRLRWVAPLLVFNAVAMVAMFAVMMGVGELVTRENVGLVQRINSLTNMPWVGFVGWALREQLVRKSAHEPASDA